jgi:hypothetical protein
MKKIVISVIASTILFASNDVLKNSPTKEDNKINISINESVETKINNLTISIQKQQKETEEMKKIIKNINEKLKKKDNIISNDRKDIKLLQKNLKKKEKTIQNLEKKINHIEKKEENIVQINQTLVTQNDNLNYSINTLKTELLSVKNNLLLTKSSINRFTLEPSFKVTNESLYVTKAEGNKKENKDILSFISDNKLNYKINNNLSLNSNIIINKKFGIGSNFASEFDNNIMINSLSVDLDEIYLQHTTFNDNNTPFSTIKIGRQILNPISNDDTINQSLYGSFDSALINFDLENSTTISGLNIGFYYARAFNNNFEDYLNLHNTLEQDAFNTKNTTTEYEDNNIFGVYLIPFENNHLKISFNAYRSTHVPGFAMAEGTLNEDFTLNGNGLVSKLEPTFTDEGFQGFKAIQNLNTNLSYKSLGSIINTQARLDIKRLSSKTDTSLQTFLNQTNVYASFAFSKTLPFKKYKQLELCTTSDDLISDELNNIEDLQNKTPTETAFYFEKMNYMKLNNLTEEDMILDCYYCHLLEILDDLNDTYHTNVELNPEGTLINQTITNDNEILNKELFNVINNVPTEWVSLIGNEESKKGYSWVVGGSIPLTILEGKITMEWTKGSKFWTNTSLVKNRINKYNTRGVSKEIKLETPITENIDMELSLLNMRYDYTGSHSLYGEEAKPLTMAQAIDCGLNPIKEETYIGINFNYNF